MLLSEVLRCCLLHTHLHLQTSFCKNRSKTPESKKTALVTLQQLCCRSGFKSQKALTVLPEGAEQEGAVHQKQVSQKTKAQNSLLENSKMQQPT